MSSHHSLVILTLKVHSDVIPSFLSNFKFKTSIGCHLIIPWPFRPWNFIQMSSHHSWFIPSLCHHSYAISSFLVHSDLKSSFRCHPIIPMSFHHSQVIPSLCYISFLCHSFIPCSFRYFSIIQMSFHHSSVIPSIIVHVDNILSFGCHSIHSMVIRALEWRGMTLWWNDRNEVRMTFQSFQGHSFHSHHPKFLRK